VLALGFTIVTCDRDDAFRHERCNLLPLGDRQYVAFSMPSALQSELGEKAGISITCPDRDGIAKAAGGVHCLTRPIYR
jgi:N-dimethylarginine dimethylaminohydrolase